MRMKMKPMGRIALLCLMLLITCSGIAEAAELRPGAVEAWDAYVRLTEARIERELRSSSGFLVLDFQPQPKARADRAALRRGEIVVSEMETRNGDGSSIDVPDAIIHHWRGAVLLPGVALEELLARQREAHARGIRQPDVLESKVLARTADSMRIYLKLVRRKIVTVTYNTEHLVRYVTHGEGRASSRSRALRIAELEDAGTKAEREKPEGQDSGFLWRLNSYWRYEQVEGGVLVECESITLSRDIPFPLAPLVRPIIDRVARETMDRTLRTMREREAGD